MSAIFIEELEKEDALMQHQEVQITEIRKRYVSKRCVLCGKNPGDFQFKGHHVCNCCLNLVKEQS
jgi:hypothetical protein